MENILETINSLDDLKELDIDELNILAKDIRKFLVRNVSKTGGHLSSNLGVVELTIALHYSFNSPVDKLIWDVGHQSYIHKILTGRKDRLKTIRQYGGISGFLKRDESVHDIFDAGHSSTSISAALGFAKARDITGQNHSIVSIIGDGALTAGLAFEGLNNAASLKSNFIIILNDNQMSISKNVGALSVYLDSIRTGYLYNEVKEDVQKILRRMIPRYGEEVINTVKDIKDGVKQLIIPGMFFEEMGFTYLGLIDGHNIKQLIKTMDQAKKVDGPVIVHINTTKGKGYKYAENFPDRFHGTKPFDIKTGKAINKKSISFSSVFGKTLCKLAEKDPQITAITAAMPGGTGLKEFSELYPTRFFDVGIAEQHAVTFAGGLALAGYKPFVAIYSSFLQRAYDQIVHDICMQNLPVVFAIDRAGIVGEDGETHQGVFDVSFLNHIPNMVIIQPKDTEELQQMLIYASEYKKGPIAIRYPKGTVNTHINEQAPIVFGKSEVIYQGKDVAIICIGTMFEKGLEAYHQLVEDGLTPTLVNARFIKPIDKELILELANNHRELFIIEENLTIGGYGSMVLRLINDYGLDLHVNIIGIEDKYVEHGKREILLEKLGLDGNGIYKRITKNLK